MRLCTFMFVLCFVFAAPAMADAVVSLQPAADNARQFHPYGKAELTVENSTGQIVRGLGIRWKSGGPTFLHEVIIAPGTKLTLSVPLPTLSVQSTYQVRLLAEKPSAENANAPAIAELDATVTWPAQDVEEARATFVDSAAYRRVESNLPLWPENLRRNLFITLFLTCLVSAGVLFIRGAALRIVALLVIASGGVLASAVQITREKTVFEQVVPAKPTMAPSIESPPTNNADAGKLLMISCRRTTEWTGPAASVIPVYANLRDLSTDTTTIVWGRELHTVVHPDKVRLLRMRE